MRGPGILLYDGDCGFCTTSSEWIVARATTVPGDEVRPWRPSDADAYGVTPEQAEREIHYVSPTGAVLAGADAVFAWWRRCGRPWDVLGRALDLPPARQVSAVAYRWIAAHRHLLPGATAACRATTGPAAATTTGSDQPRFATATTPVTLQRSR